MHPQALQLADRHLKQARYALRMSRFFSTPSFRFRPLHCATLFGNELGWNARSEAPVVAKSVKNAADVTRIPLNISRLSLRHKRFFLRRIAVAELMQVEYICVQPFFEMIVT